MTLREILTNLCGGARLDRREKMAVQAILERCPAVVLDLRITERSA